MKQNILIAGLGLIGGSLAKALGKSNSHHLIGFDTNNETLKYAVEKNIINQAYEDFAVAALEADIIILAAPISKTIQLMKSISKIKFKHDVIVTDVSSVKGSILNTAKSLENDRVTFIGGHPMAGSHKTGIRSAKAHLFENAIYVLTPETNGSNIQVEILKDALQITKCRFIVLQPEEHDEMTSVVSHFPHLIASSLVHQAKKWQDTHEYLPELAAGGFRDITRIASSNPIMWQDIFQHNGHKMSHLLDEWISEMMNLKKMLESNEKENMISYLDQAKKYRDGLDKNKKGAIRSFYDLYVDIKDQPGALALVVQMLAVKGISITNIRILEIREDINGALRISVPNKESQISSYNLLKKHGYEVMIEE